ncbi:MAG TPA: YicC/YloC family endoribonuclease [Terriglobia bacterium]|nr:YicC/YloC family endoribonuclease [Terriglobia bacterium]
MINSMTGFGSARAEAQNLTVLVEIKSVNHRYIDTHVKMPAEFQTFEPAIRKRIAAAFRRGRFDVFARIDYRREDVRLEANLGLIRAYAELLDTLKRDFPIQGELTMDMLSRAPGLISVAGLDLGPEEMERIGRAVEEATGNAIRQLARMRAVEGESLMADVEQRLAAISGYVETIHAGAREFVDHYREQLIRRVTELAPQLAAESGHRIEMEALLHAEKSDITEETTRLRSHLDQFASLKNLKDEAGKRMDFILQEMNREATTVLSKTSGLHERGAAIGQAAIEIKVEIEKLREQVQNIE